MNEATSIFEINPGDPRGNLINLINCRPEDPQILRHFEYINFLSGTAIYIGRSLEEQVQIFPSQLIHSVDKSQEQYSELNLIKNKETEIIYMPTKVRNLYAISPRQSPIALVRHSEINVSDKANLIQAGGKYSNPIYGSKKAYPAGAFVAFGPEFLFIKIQEELPEFWKPLNTKRGAKMISLIKEIGDYRT